jgi:hypothetical protein
MKRILIMLAVAVSTGACTKEEETAGGEAPATTTQVVSQQQPSQRASQQPAVTAIERAGVVDDEDTDTETATETATATEAALPNVEPACEGSGCGVTEDGSYSGAGVGVWSYHNDSDASVEVGVRIPGTTGKTVTVVFTNLSSGAVAMPAVDASFNLAAGLPAASQSPQEPRVRHFQPRVPIDTPFQSGRAASQRRDFELPTPPPVHYIVGDARNFYHEDDSLRATTLRKQVTAGDGRVVNFWVENGEYGLGLVTSTHLDTIAARFATGSDSIYTSVTGIAGQPWGAHPYDNLIDATQDIDVVFLNFTDDATPYGMLGYFWARNAYKTSSQPRSNASLSFYMDTETIYLASGDAGLREMIATLAHEFMHMINFYQRGVRKTSGDYTFDTWLEETTATMVEDVVGQKLDASYHPIRDGRYSDWLAMGDFNCNPTSAAAFGGLSPSCFGYSVAGALGGHLLRHFGLSFFASLLQDDSSTDSEAVLDNVLRANGATLEGEIWRWGVSLALLPAATSPEGFGYPELVDGGFTMPGFDGGDFTSVRVLPQSVPTTLLHYGHFPAIRPSPGATFTETLTVPAGMVLSVVVQ